jgi:adenosylmethionine-8-amino-7-oxononanoate aminotransferase
VATANLDLSHIWLDFQQMAAFERDPIVVASADGIRVQTTDGRELVDGISAAMVTNLGYSNERVKQAMVEQIRQLCFWPVLHATTEPAVALANRLCEVLPGDLDRAFLLSGGSEATECAMKMARQYHVETGNPRKVKVVSRYWAYHGSTKGALSASGVGDKHKFEPFLAGYVHVLPPYCYRCPFGQPGPDRCRLECASAIEATIRYEGPETVAAVIVDPVMAAAGVLVPPRDYYRRLREVCDRYNVLLIFDEVLTGFGRLGEWFAADHYDVLPDIVCLGKGIAGGYAPLAATVARKHVADAFLGAPEDRVQFLHGNTYGGHPVACAAGLAAIEEYERLGIVENARAMGEHLRRGLEAIAERVPIVGDVRVAGLLAGVELVADRANRVPFPKGIAPGPLVLRHALRKENLILRGARDVVQLAPPLVVTIGELDDILERFERALTATAAELGG